MYCAWRQEWGSERKRIPNWLLDEQVETDRKNEYQTTTQKFGLYGLENQGIITMKVE